MEEPILKAGTVPPNVLPVQLLTLEGVEAIIGQGSRAVVPVARELHGEAQA